MADIHDLRKDLLEHAMEYFEEKHEMQKKFAKLFFEYKLKQGIPIENYAAFMPAMYTPQEAIDLAKAMELYITGAAK